MVTWKSATLSVSILSLLQEDSPGSPDALRVHEKSKVNLVPTRFVHKFCLLRRPLSDHLPTPFPSLVTLCLSLMSHMGRYDPFSDPSSKLVPLKTTIIFICPVVSGDNIPV